MEHVIICYSAYRPLFLFYTIGLLVIEVFNICSRFACCFEKRHVILVPWSELHHCITLYNISLLQHFLRNVLPLRRWWYLLSIEYFLRRRQFIRLVCEDILMIICHFLNGICHQRKCCSSNDGHILNRLKIKNLIRSINLIDICHQREKRCELGFTNKCNGV